jgi:hypothetical protein
MNQDDYPSWIDIVCWSGVGLATAALWIAWLAGWIP